MKRDKKITLRLTQKELDRLNEMVAKTPYNREVFLRRMLEGYTIQEVPKDFFQFRRAVISIAYNLDQLSKSGWFSWQEREELESLTKECRELVRVLMAAFIEKKGKEECQ